MRRVSPTFRVSSSTHCLARTAEGQELFAAAMKEGHCRSFFPLVAQFRTQDEPAFCGLASLTMALNALRVDPGVRWNGVWRWYSERSLTCCKPLEEVEAEGISIAQLACLARCNTLHAQITTLSHPAPGVVDAARKAAGTSLPDESADAAAIVAWLAADSAAFCATLPEADVAGLRTALKQHCAAPPPLTSVLIANYARGVLGQTGSGHFSPLAAFVEEADAVLILDTARFKYPPHWVSLGRLAAAMAVPTSDGGHRGYLSVQRMAAAPLIMFELSAVLRDGRVQPGGGCQCSDGTPGKAADGCRSGESWQSLLAQMQRELAAVLRGAAQDCMAAAVTSPGCGDGRVADPIALARLAVAGVVSRLVRGPTAGEGPLKAVQAASQSAAGFSRAESPAASHRKWSDAQKADATSLLQQLEATDMFKWVSEVLPHAATDCSEEGCKGVHVTRAHSVSMLLLAACHPGSSGQEGSDIPFQPCCSVAVDAWRGFQALVMEDVAGAAGSSDGVGVLANEVHLLRQQLAALEVEA